MMRRGDSPAYQRNGWTYTAMLLVVFALSAGSVFSAQKVPSYLDLPMRRLTAWGSPRETVTLRKLCQEDPGLVVYVWQADKSDLQSEPVDERSKIWRVARKEMALLRDDVATGVRYKVVSVVTVWSHGRAGTQAEREEVYRKIQDMAKRTDWYLGDPNATSAPRMPLFVDVTNTDNTITHRDLAAAIIAETGERNLKPPLLAMVRKVNGQFLLRVRGNAPVRASAWVHLLDAAPPQNDPELQIPSDCTDNVFRRHIARVLKAGLLRPRSLTSADAFMPKEFMTERGFIDELAKIPGIHPEVPAAYKPDSPMTRERAVTAVVTALYATKTADSCPNPVGANSWGEAREDLPGSTRISDDAKNSIALALAKGLICFEPTLRPDDPIRRDEAAWLLSHALVGHGTDGLQDNAGLLIDAIDIPLTPFSFQYRGEIYAREGSSDLVRIYPQAETDLLPAPPDNYASAFFISQTDIDLAAGRLPQGGTSDPGSHSSASAKTKWLAERVGATPLVVRALDVPGPGRLPNGDLILACSVTVSREDREAIRKANVENGLLDDWRVAFLTGVGARISPPLNGVVPRDATITLQFTTEMDGSTILSPQNLWVESVGNETPKPIPVAIEGAQLASSRVKEIRVRLPNGLSPGGKYRLVMGAGVLSAKGEPISSHTFLSDEPPLPTGIARRWEFQIDPIVSLYLRPVGLPADSKLEAEIGGAWVEIQPSQPVSVPAGDLHLQVKTAAGVFAQPSVKIGNESSYDVAVVLPKPDQIRALGPSFVTVGDKGQIVLEALDGEGKPIAHHAPVELTLSATGGTVSPAWLIMTGRSTVEFTATTPGRAAVRISVADRQVRCEPEVGVLCRSKWSELPDWSDEEWYHALAPEPGTRDICISPRLRRWFAQSDQDGAPKHRVKLSAASDGDRRELTEMTTPPLRYAFKRDSEGFLYVNRLAGDDLILAYEYHKGRCGVLVTGGSGEQAASKALRSELDGLLRRIGYECVTDAELVAALGNDYTPGEVPTDAQAVAAIAALSLDDVFVAHLTHAGRDVYDLSWAAWTKGQGAPWSTQGQQVSSRRMRVGTEPGSAVDPKELRAATQVLLDPWLKLVGLSFGRDVRRTE